jgi:HK97 family phage major capsid protein
MFTVTPKLKSYMVETHGVAADATDEVVNKAIADLLLEGKLDVAKVKELTKADAEDAQVKVKSIIADELKSFKDEMKSFFTEMKGEKEEKIEKTTENLGEKLYESNIAKEGKEGTVRVKSAVERYDDTRTAATWDKSVNPYLAKNYGGQPVASHIDGLPYSVDMPTNRMKAIAGAVFKKKALDAMKAAGQYIPEQYKMSQHDNDLLTYAAHECKWVGDFKGFTYDGENLSELHRKAILDDSTSGGLEAVPIEFDALAILTPLLHSQLFPLVNIINVTRRRIEAAKIGNPTLTWGIADGTAIGLFNTDAFISAFDNNIHPITGAIEMGEDFLADSPLNIGAIVVRNYGEAFKQEMDNVIATGDGVTQPEGWFTTSGVTSVTPTSAGNAPTVSDYEGLMFGVSLAYRQEAGLGRGSRAVFLGNETSYSRARGIPVDSSADARRIFGMDEESYILLEHRYAVNATLTNPQYGFFCMNRYRMYRRQGLEVKFVTSNTDWQLARENKTGLVVRARFGGAPEQSAAGAKIVTGQN